MKALLLFSSQVLRIRVQALLDVHGIFSQVIENQFFERINASEFQSSTLITDDQVVHKKLKFNALLSSKALVITSASHSAAVTYMEMLENVDGIIDQDFSDDILMQAFEEISNGMAFICPRIASSLKHHFQHQKNRISNLSDKELDVVKLLVKGDSYARIADTMGMSINTVRFHVKNIYKKHNIHNKTLLSRYFHDFVIDTPIAIKPAYN